VRLAEIEDAGFTVPVQFGPDEFTDGPVEERHEIALPVVDVAVAALQRIAPVTAIRGNVDTGNWASKYADTELVTIAGKSIFVLHDLKTLRIDPVARGIDVVVSGHSHVPKIDTVGGVLYLNPGSAGRRRFRLPITLATIDVTPVGLRPAIHDLGDK
jgi:uncharacterized protein